MPCSRSGGWLKYRELVCISEGRLVHIDFGFILETSPGGNMRFESAQFKLSHEMTQLLDPSGIMKSDIWNCFVRSAHSSLCLTFLSANVKQHGPSLQLKFYETIALVCFSICSLSLGPYKWQGTVCWGKWDYRFCEVCYSSSADKKLRGVGMAAYVWRATWQQGSIWRV
jgi:hypothetical protein